MKVKQLKALLEKYPDNMDIFLAERKTEFTYGLLNTVKLEEITFSEEPESNPLAKETVLILDEE